MPSKSGCWSGFFNCANKAVPIVRDVASGVENILSHTHGLLTVLGTAGLLTPAAPAFAAAMAAIKGIEITLPIIKGGFEKVVKHIPEDFDLHEILRSITTGKINVLGLVGVLERLSGVLDALVLKKVLPEDDAAKWKEIIAKLIAALQEFPDKTSTIKALKAKATQKITVQGGNNLTEFDDDFQPVVDGLTGQPDRQLTQLQQALQRAQESEQRALLTVKQAQESEQRALLTVKQLRQDLQTAQNRADTSDQSAHYFQQACEKSDKMMQQLAGTNRELTGVTKDLAAANATQAVALANASAIGATSGRNGASRATMFGPAQHNRELGYVVHTDVPVTFHY